MSQKHLLNKMCPVADMVDIGDKLDAIITLINELKTKFNSHVTKTGIHYDGAAGVTDSSNAPTSASVDPLT